jgi:hypothetical protein
VRSEGSRAASTRVDALGPLDDERTVHRIVGRGSFLAAILLTARLLAAPPPGRTARLAYVRGHGAEQCPDERAFRDAVETRLGYAPWSDAATRSIAVIVQQAGGALRGDVTMTDAAGAVTGTRQLTAAGNDCVELVTAMALAISIAIDPDVVFRPVPPPAAPPTAAAPGAIPSASASPRPAHVASLPLPSVLAEPLPAAVAAPAPASRPIRWHLGVSGFFAGGTSPGVTGGVAVQAGLRWTALSATLEGRADVPTTAPVTGGGVVRAGLLAADVVPCFHLGPVAACGLGTFGALRGVGADVARPRDDATPFVALGGRLGAELRFDRTFSAGIHGDLSATLTPTTLVVDGRGVWTTPRASATLGAGVTAHFP